MDQNNFTIYWDIIKYDEIIIACPVIFCAVQEDLFNFVSSAGLYLPTILRVLPSSHNLSKYIHQHMIGF